MVYKVVKTTLELGKLYKVYALRGTGGSQQIHPSLWFSNGSVDVYGSNSMTQPTSKDEPYMTLDEDNIAVSGEAYFPKVPTYIYLDQNSGNTTEIVATDLVVEDLGAF